MAKSGAPEVRLGCGLAVGHENGLRKPPAAKGRHLGVRSRSFDGEGSSAWRRITGAQVLGGLGFGFRCNRVRVCAQIQSEARQGQREAVRQCRVSAMAGAAWRHYGDPSRTAPQATTAYTYPNLAHKEEGNTEKLTRGSVVRRSGGIPATQARLDGACARSTSCARARRCP